MKSISKTIACPHLAPPSGPPEPTSEVIKVAPGPCLDLAELRRTLSAGPPPELWRHVGACLRCARAVATLDRSVVRRALTACGGPMRVADPADYEGKAPLGGGRTYRLFRAFDRRRGAEVVLKELPARAELADPDQRPLLEACLLREASLLAGLRHPAIVTLLEAGEWRRTGEAFYATAPAPGVALRDAAPRSRGRDGRLALLRAFAAVADAVAYAHARGVAHRDINPGAIVYDEASGRASIVDWSAARPFTRRSPGDAVCDAAELPRGGPNVAALGTPGFAAPERASPRRDHRADIFSLGATLHFVATGRAADAGPEGPSASAGARDDRRGEAAACPEPLRAIVAKATADDPESRHRSADELASELRRCLRR
ncbi:MAG TPA: protein kinase [Polyangiaceae bacterium]|nr:protein kinase [Polyangiaceae bacterium]